MKHWLFVFVLIFLGTGTALQAQDAYTQAAGLRVGPLTGLSYKRFVTFAGTVEGILGYNFTNGRTFSLTGLYEQHFFLTYELNAFAGGGLTFGGNKEEFRMLGEAIVGLEYTFRDFPLNFSADYKPAFHIFEQQFFFNEFAFTIRYVF